jgi:adenylylsulfate kinase-like enzyme
MYVKARRGELKNVTGIDDPYESPRNPEITVDTVGCPVDENAGRIISYLLEQGYLRR